MTLAVFGQWRTATTAAWGTTASGAAARTAFPTRILWPDGAQQRREGDLAFPRHAIEVGLSLKSGEELRFTHDIVEVRINGDPTRNGLPRTERSFRPAGIFQDTRAAVAVLIYTWKNTC